MSRPSPDLPTDGSGHVDYGALPDRIFGCDRRELEAIRARACPNGDAPRPGGRGHLVGYDGLIGEIRELLAGDVELPLAAIAARLDVEVYEIRHAANYARWKGELTRRPRRGGPATWSRTNGSG